MNIDDVLPGHDIAYCCLGTTRKDAGSDREFKKVDFGYVVNFARKCKEAGINHFHLVSSVGANKDSWFLYPKTKGQAEQACIDIGFSKTLYL